MRDTFHLKNHELKGYNKYKYFLQRICVTLIDESVPLCCLEVMICSFFFWKTFDESGSILGALPSAVLSENTLTFGFEYIKHHTRNRLTYAFMNTTSN